MQKYITRIKFTSDRSMEGNVGVAGEDIELDNELIDGALDLMALASGNNTLDEETIRKSEQLKRIVAQKSEDQSRNGRESRTRVSVNPSQLKRKGKKKQIKINKSHQHEASTSSRSSVVRTELAAGSSLKLPAGIQELVGLCSLPTQKQITKSDVNHGQCRLMLPRYWVMKRLKDMAVSPNECKGIDELGIPASVYGPDRREYVMKFVSWTEQKFYVLKSKMWKQFCQDYGLGTSTTHMETLTIWMFRHRQTNDLCFAINW